MLKMSDARNAYRAEYKVGTPEEIVRRPSLREWARDNYHPDTVMSEKLAQIVRGKSKKPQPKTSR